MPLLVGQIVYTSFPGTGFKSLASQQIPLEIQQSFIYQIVHQHWDTYNPPQMGYRAVYLHQFASDRNIFGWLYNDGTDELGRSNIPYCIGYYLQGSLSTVQLESILTCLELGPIAIVDRNNPPSILGNTAIPDLCTYEPVRPGVEIAPDIRKQTHKNLLQKKLLNLFVDFDDRDKGITIDINSLRSLSASEPNIDWSNRQSLNLIKIERILQELIAKPIGTQGVALVSSEGQPLVPAIGMDKNSTLVMAGSMLYLAKNTQDEFDWQNIETVTVRAREGHVVLAHCDNEIFLLVKAGKALSGLLEGEINRTVEKIKTVLQNSQEKAVPSQAEFLPHLPPETLPKIDEVLQDFNAELALEKDNEIRYRGRRTNL